MTGGNLDSLGGIHAPHRGRGGGRDAAALPRQGAVANKLEAGFDPVTEADREAERRSEH